MRRSLLVPVLLLATVIVASPARAASITFKSATITSNEPFPVEILILDVDDLFGFNFDIAFDQTIVGLVSVSRGDVFTGLGLPCDDCFFPGLTDINGVVSFIGDSVSGVVMGFSGTARTLAVLTFQALGSTGNAGLSVRTGEGELLFFNSRFELIDISDVVNGVVTIDVPLPPTPVPEPSTLALLGIGLAAMARKRLKRKTRYLA